jgi:hypothetical protein
MLRLSKSKRYLKTFTLCRYNTWRTMMSAITTRKTMSTDRSTLTQPVGSRIHPDVIAELRRYAAQEGITPSRFIARLVTREVKARKVAEAASFGGDDA